MSIIAAGTTSGTALVSTGDTNGTLVIQTNGTTVAATFGTDQSLTLVGATTFAAGSAAAPALTTTGDTNTGIFFSAADTIAVSTAGLERLRVDSAGRMMVNGTTAIDLGRISVTFTGADSTGVSIKHTNASATMSTYQNSAGTAIGSITSNGTNIAYNTSSDYRLKENIAPMLGALAKVTALRPVTYTWKETGIVGEGFIAHELAAVCVDAVHGEKDAVNADGSIKPQGIDTSFLVATLTAAIQELKAEFDAYKAAHP